MVEWDVSGVVSLRRRSLATRPFNLAAVDALKALWLRWRDAVAAFVTGAGGLRSGVGRDWTYGTAYKYRGTREVLNPIEAFLDEAIGVRV